MTVLLRSSNQLADIKSYDFWLAVTGTRPLANKERMLPELAGRLERAFNNISESWWQIACRAAITPSAEYSYALVCSPIASDFGLMLAWSDLATELATESSTCLIVCDDPWLFRHIAELANVQAGPPPPLWPPRLTSLLRGLASRSSLAVRLSVSSLKLRSQRRNHAGATSFLAVYGHPQSTADGHDAYFGDLMAELPSLGRLLHTDCPPGMARKLAGDGKTASLHAWGNFLYPLRLLFVRWRPSREDCSGEFGWLIRRAAILEGRGAAHAMTAWTRHCLENWARAVKPEKIAWPWENLPWERLLVRMARRHGISSIGYQHADVGPHQYNMSPSGNPDGLEGIPERIVLNGKGYKGQLIAWGIPETRMVEGGAFRMAPKSKVCFDAQGPVFVALSGLLPVARQMLQAIADIRDSPITFLIKEHPMYPIDFDESANMQRTNKPLSEQQSVRAVLFGTGMSGLEGLLAGLPTFRLMLNDRVSINSLPEQFFATPVTAEHLLDALRQPSIPPEKKWHDLFSPVDLAVWRDVFAAGR